MNAFDRATREGGFRVAGRGIGAGARRLLAGVGRWLERRRQLNALTALDEQQLRDIGLTRDDVARARRKPLLLEWRK